MLRNSGYKIVGPHHKSYIVWKTAVFYSKCKYSDVMCLIQHKCPEQIT